MHTNPNIALGKHGTMHYNAMYNAIFWTDIGQIREYHVVVRLNWTIVHFVYSHDGDFQKMISSHILFDMTRTFVQM